LTFVWVDLVLPGSLRTTLPSVVTGQNHEVHFPSNVTPISISFNTGWGPLTLEVGPAPAREHAEV